MPSVNRQTISDLGLVKSNLDRLSIILEPNRKNEVFMGYRRSRGSYGGSAHPGVYVLLSLVAMIIAIAAGSPVIFIVMLFFFAVSLLLCLVELFI